MLTPLIMKLEHFLPLPNQDKDWLNGLVSRYEEVPEHLDIIREGEMPAAGISLRHTEILGKAFGQVSQANEAIKQLRRLMDEDVRRAGTPCAGE